MRSIAIYLSGSIRKGEKDSNKICWEKEDKDFIRNELEGWEVMLLDPQSRGDDLSDHISVFGRDMTQVANCDFVLVDGRQKRGVGVGMEMLMAKMRGIPVVSVIPKNSHYHRDKVDYLGQTVRNFTHPAFYAISDHIAEDLASAMAWVKEQLMDPRPVKGLHVVEDAMKRYRETQLEKDKKMKEFLSGRQ